MTHSTHAPPTPDAEQLLATIRKEHESLNALLEEVRKVDVVNVALYAQARLKQIRETFDREVTTYMAAEHAALVADGDRQQRSLVDLLDRATALTREAQDTAGRLTRLHAELPRLAASAENLRTELTDVVQNARASIDNLHRERTGLEAVHRRLVEELLAHSEAAEDRVDDRMRGWLGLAQSRARAAFLTFVLVCCATIGITWALSSRRPAPAPAAAGTSEIIVPLPGGTQPPDSLTREEAAALTHPDARGDRRAFILARGNAHVGLALRTATQVHLYTLHGGTFTLRGSITQTVRTPDDLVRAYPEYAKFLQ